MCDSLFVSVPLSRLYHQSERLCLTVCVTLSVCEPLAWLVLSERKSVYDCVCVWLSLSVSVHVSVWLCVCASLSLWASRYINIISFISISPFYSLHLQQVGSWFSLLCWQTKQKTVILTNRQTDTWSTYSESWVRLFKWCWWHCTDNGSFSITTKRWLKYSCQLGISIRNVSTKHNIHNSIKV